MCTAEQLAGTSSAEQPADAAAPQPAVSGHATAQAAAEEECHRAVVDLQEVARKLDKHQFQDKAKLLENADNKAMFVAATDCGTYCIPGCAVVKGQGGICKSCARAAAAVAKSAEAAAAGIMESNGEHL